MIQILDVLKPRWVFDSAKDLFFILSPSAIHSISFHLKAGSLMAAMILGVKQLPKKRRQFFLIAFSYE